MTKTYSIHDILRLQSQGEPDASFESRKNPKIVIGAIVTEGSKVRDL